MAVLGAYLFLRSTKKKSRSTSIIVYKNSLHRAFSYPNSTYSNQLSVADRKTTTTVNNISGINVHALKYWQQRRKRGRFPSIPRNGLNYKSLERAKKKAHAVSRCPRYNSPEGDFARPSRYIDAALLCTRRCYLRSRPRRSDSLARADFNYMTESDLSVFRKNK